MLSIPELFGPVWTLLAIPFLIFLAPRLMRFLVPVLLGFQRRHEKSGLRAQIREYRSELSKISQTDEFAKYSKIQRKLRAVTDQLNSINNGELEQKFKYGLVGHAACWLLAVVLFIRLVFKSLGF